jgi:hypothetical protein
VIAAASLTRDDIDLAKLIRKYYADPLGFVRMAFPWGEPGPLAEEEGPDANQIEFLESLGKEVRERNFDGHTPVMPILMSETSGHGTGKSAMGAWLACWILSTRPHSIGTVTAGTFTQLESRTWAAIKWWMSLCITARWFEVQSGCIYAHEDPENWKLIIQTCRPENAQSFAGQHAKRSTSWYLFDEASTVPDEVWKVALGGLTDGEPMFFAWGQPERNTGQFYEICFGRERDRWNHRTIDSRSSRFTNKQLIEQWIRDYGEDSDWCRVRIFGLPPRASELQFIDKERIENAQKRNAVPLDDEPLIAGVDVSGGGAAWNVIRFRRGLDAKSMAPIRIPGEHGRDRQMLVNTCNKILSEDRPSRKVAMMFIDSAFGAPIAERLKMLGFNNVVEVNFGGRSPNQHQLNWRSFMWNAMKDWLLKGAIDPDERLAIDLASPGYHINHSGKLVIEAKEEIVRRIGRSPDDGDALALTFALQVGPNLRPRRAAPGEPARDDEFWR